MTIGPRTNLNHGCHIQYTTRRSCERYHNHSSLPTDWAGGDIHSGVQITTKDVYVIKSLGLWTHLEQYNIT